MAKYIVVKFTAASVASKVTWASLQHGSRVPREQKLKLPVFQFKVQNRPSAAFH